MLQGSDAVLAEEVASYLSQGPVTIEVAQAVQDRFPEAAASLYRWIQAAAAVQDWRRVEIFANLGAMVRAPDLDKAIVDLLDSNPHGLNQEDLVDILGELTAVAAAGAIFRVVKRSLKSDAPAYWLCQKAILSLSELETDEANHYLKEMTNISWPNAIRWHAAVALCVEDELGFDEDLML